MRNRILRRFELGQHHRNPVQRRQRVGDEAGLQRSVRTGSDHDAVAALRIDIDAGGAGGRVALRIAQVDAVVGAQHPRQLRADIGAQRAGEGCVGARAARGHRLVEALAAGAAGVLAAQRGPGLRQRRHAPHVVDVERADDRDARHPISRRTSSARRRWSRS